jgi:hypothetical protein
MPTPVPTPKPRDSTFVAIEKLMLKGGGAERERFRSRKIHIDLNSKISFEIYTSFFSIAFRQIIQQHQRRHDGWWVVGKRGRVILLG